MIEELGLVPCGGDVQMLGQTTPASEGTVRMGFSNAEKILLAGVVISAIGLTVNLLSATGYLRPRRMEEGQRR